MTATILDGRAISASSPTGLTDDPRAYLLACYPKAEIQPLAWTIPSARPMTARVNHGVWIASCECGAGGLPSPGCVVFLDQPLGWCVRCGNRQHGGFWRPIVAPPEHGRRLIEAILLCRPNIGDRNWEPGETIADLVAQNREHGDPIPDLDVIRIGPLYGPGLAETIAPFPPSAVMRSVLAEKAPRRGLRRFLGR